ncbi:hypothetical protein ACIQM4_27840 [Streptomyces sp. NPDC091272]|uniref:hypothetical protein n=1 Tax=Streptomyces sp. NPDC091272 TaxID=3365981 RepID=UPI00381FEFDE
MLPLAAEVRDGYQRTAFRHWVDVDHNACDTREEVLLSESRSPADVGPGCKVLSGSWFSYYDGVTVSAPGGLDIDHMVSAAPKLQREELKGQNVGGIPTTSLRASLGAAADPGQQLEDLTVAPKGSMDGYSRDKYG